MEIVLPDNPDAHSGPIVIVGGGCSGLLVAVQLFRHGFRGRLTVIDTRERLGGGLAYSTSSDQHLIKVPAASISALEDRPAHFLDWLCAQHWPDADANANAFTPRKLYGEYLSDLLQQTIRDCSPTCLDHIRAQAIDAHADASGARLHLSDG